MKKRKSGSILAVHVVSGLLVTVDLSITSDARDSLLLTAVGFIDHVAEVEAEGAGGVFGVGIMFVELGKEDEGLAEIS